MKTTTRIAMCLLLMGLFTATTGCDDVLPSGFGEALGSFMESDIFDTDIEDGGWGDDDGGWGNDDGGWGSTDGTYQGDSSSGTFFSDHGGGVSWS